MDNASSQRRDTDVTTRVTIVAPQSSLAACYKVQSVYEYSFERPIKSLFFLLESKFLTNSILWCIYIIICVLLCFGVYEVSKWRLHNFNSNNRIYLLISMCVGSGNWNSNDYRYLLEINKVYLENFPRFKLLEDEVTQRYF